VSPSRRRGCVEHVVTKLGVSERTACRVLGQHRSSQRKVARSPNDEAALTADIVELARRYGRYGYRRITALLRHAGWQVNRKRVERIWRRPSAGSCRPSLRARIDGAAIDGLKVPAKQPKRDRLWQADGSLIRLRPERPNQVWAYDFVEDRTRDTRKFQMLCVVDEFTREALAIRVARRLDSNHVIEVLADLCLVRGVPEHIRSDQGPEFIATTVKDWIAAVGAKTAYIEKSSPWENGYVESFNGKLRDELLNIEIFNSLREAQIMIENWRRHYNTIRPHSALGYRPPAPEVIVRTPTAWPAAQPRPAPPATLRLVPRPALN
jgi:putative transposase